MARRWDFDATPQIRPDVKTGHELTWWNTTLSLRFIDVQQCEFSTDFLEPTTWRVSVHSLSLRGPLVLTFKVSAVSQGRRPPPRLPFHAVRGVDLTFDFWHCSSNVRRTTSVVEYDFEEGNGFSYAWEVGSLNARVTSGDFVLNLWMGPHEDDSGVGIANFNDPDLRGKFLYSRGDLELLRSHLRTMMAEGQFADTVLRSSDDGSSRDAHSCLLATRWDRVLPTDEDDESDWNPGEHPPIEVRLSVPGPVLDALLDFAYLGDLVRVREVLRDPDLKGRLVDCVRDHHLWRLYKHLSLQLRRTYVRMHHAVARLGHQLDIPVRDDAGHLLAKSWVSCNLPGLATERVDMSYCFYDTGLGDAVRIVARADMRRQAPCRAVLTIQTGPPHVTSQTVTREAYGDRTRLVFDFEDVPCRRQDRVQVRADLAFTDLSRSLVLRLGGTYPNEASHDPLEGLSTDMAKGYVLPFRPDCVAVSTSVEQVGTDDGSIPVHRCILQSRLDVTDRQLVGEYFMDLKPDALEMLIRYIYCGKLYVPDMTDVIYDRLLDFVQSLDNCDEPIYNRLAKLLSQWNRYRVLRLGQ